MILLICIFALYIAIQTIKCNCPNSCGTNRTKICPIDASYRCVDGCEYYFCEPGSKYSSKLNKCVDINECSVEELVDLCTFDRPSDPGLCGENYTCTLSFINCSTASNPVCGNSNCKNLDGGYVCYCPDNLILIEGENGYTCQQVVCENGELVGSDNKCHPNPCHDNKCMGNGKCEFIDPPKFYCRCDTGYSGENCGNKKCPDEIEMFFEDEVEWREEKIGEVAQINCGHFNSMFIGLATRRCTWNSTWGASDYSQCIRDRFNTLYGNIIELQDNINDVIKEPLKNSLLFPGEIIVMNNALQLLIYIYADIQKSWEKYSEAENIASKDTPKIVVDVGSYLLSRANRQSWEMAGNRTTLTSLVSNFELFSIVINQSVRMDNTISMENLALSYKHIVKPSSNDLLFQIDNSNYTIMNVKISEDLIRKANESCNEIVFTSIIFKTIKDLMPYVNLNKSEEIGNVPLISDVLSINTKNCINIIPPNSIQIEYTLKSNDTKFVCAFWNLTTNTWSIQGVRTRIEYLSYGNVKIICTPTHLTTFAILLTSNIPTKPDIILQTALSSVACSFSIVSLLASLICFITLYIRTRDSSENPFKQDNIFTIHINQCIALLFAILIFLFSSLAIGYRVPCSIIAGIQQYLWISVFGWFLCESIAIAWKIRFWDRGQRLWPFLVPLGWGLPFPVVIITVPITHDFYVDPDLGCWVTNTSQLQLISFILPILLIISVNIFLYIYSLVIIHRIKERLESGRRARKIIIGSLILLPLSAVPWIIGVFYVNKDTAVFGYMFVILVGIQGVFFFIIQVARSTVIQDYVFKWKDPDEVHSKFEKLQTFQSSTQELAMEQDDETTSKL